jgi:predicted  nucleic acid-binding Zn-ribbon protein
MEREKIENKIKELNSFRARFQRDFKEIETKYNDKIISEKDYENHKRKFELKIEKIREKIRQLEEKFENLK